MKSLPFANIAAYKFVDLDPDWITQYRATLQVACRELNLRGTIVLSTEGINLFMSGLQKDVESFQDQLLNTEPFGDLEFKLSFSVDHSFRRMLVKVKKEIIPFGLPSIRPGHTSTRRLEPSDLKQWLDDGRDVLLLDTRNDFEVELGTFRSAVHLGLQNFRAFPSAINELDARDHHGPIVTFCTGGIRCEKAAPLMEELGFKNVYQLDGGILGYFEACGGEHWEGECFVFDGRVAVDPSLKETDTEFCFRCQHVLRPEDMKHSEYTVGVKCPYCSGA